MQTISNFIDKYFWISILLITVFVIVANWFTHSLSEAEVQYHTIIGFIALAVIDIRKWLNK